MALTPTEREEHFYKAMVDAADGSTPEELEPTERKEHWYKEIIDAIKAGGSGGGVLVVTINDNDVFDKTWQEVADADFVTVQYGNGYKMFCGRVIEPDPPLIKDYQVIVIDIAADNDVITFVTDSASGYPTLG